MTWQSGPPISLTDHVVIGAIGLADHALFRMRADGRANMPARGPVIVAANHLAQIDTVLIARMIYECGRFPRFMAKSNLFEGGAVGAVMRGTRQIPVSRHSADAAQSLALARAALDADQVVVIYPEGTTTKDPDGWPMQAKTGVARLVLAAPDIPVVPVSQWGAQLPAPGRLRRRRFAALIHPPLTMAHWRGMAATPQTLAAICAEVMSPIRAGVGELRRLEPPAEPYRPSPRIERISD